MIVIASTPRSGTTFLAHSISLICNAPYSHEPFSHWAVGRAVLDIQGNITKYSWSNSLISPKVFSNMQPIFYASYYSIWDEPAHITEPIIEHIRSYLTRRNICCAVKDVHYGPHMATALGNPPTLVPFRNLADQGLSIISQQWPYKPFINNMSFDEEAREHYEALRRPAGEPWHEEYASLLSVIVLRYHYNHKLYKKLGIDYLPISLERLTASPHYVAPIIIQYCGIPQNITPFLPREYRVQPMPQIRDPNITLLFERLAATIIERASERGLVSPNAYAWHTVI